MTTTSEAVHRAKLLALRGTVFRSLTEAQLDDVARISDARHFEAGGTLCTQGQFAQDTFVLAFGEVVVEIDGREVVHRRAGDIVGDWAVFGDGHRSATVRALTDVDAVVIDTREIDSLLMAAPSVAQFLGQRCPSRTP